MYHDRELESSQQDRELTTDVYEPIQIASDFVTLNGVGHAVTGLGSDIGVSLDGRTGVTVKNLAISNFEYGIRLHSSSYNIIAANNIFSNSEGIYVDWSSNRNCVQKNTVSNARYSGISIVLSEKTGVANNSVSNNGWDTNRRSG